MRKRILMTLAVFSLAFSLSAQQNAGGGEGRRGQGGQRGPSPEYLAMIDSLNLDADQKSQFDMMEDMYRKKRRTMMQEARESGKDRTEIREEMTKMRSEQTAVLQNLFTESQYTIYVEFLKKQEAQRANRRGSRGGG